VEYIRKRYPNNHLFGSCCTESHWPLIRCECWNHSTNAIDGIVIATEQVALTANANLSGYVIASDIFKESSMVTESKILENFTVTYNDLKNPFLNDQTKILSWKQ
jgi:hypothetical protein